MSIEEYKERIFSTIHDMEKEHGCNVNSLEYKRTQEEFSNVWPVYREVKEEITIELV